MIVNCTAADNRNFTAQVTGYRGTTHILLCWYDSSVKNVLQKGASLSSQSVALAQVSPYLAASTVVARLSTRRSASPTTARGAQLCRYAES